MKRKSKVVASFVLFGLSAVWIAFWFAPALSGSGDVFLTPWEYLIAGFLPTATFVIWGIYFLLPADPPKKESIR